LALQSGAEGCAPGSAGHARPRGARQRELRTRRATSAGTGARAFEAVPSNETVRHALRTAHAPLPARRPAAPRVRSGAMAAAAAPWLERDVVYTGAALALLAPQRPARARIGVPRGRGRVGALRRRAALTWRGVRSAQARSETTSSRFWPSSAPPTPRPPRRACAPGACRCACRAVRRAASRRASARRLARGC